MENGNFFPTAGAAIPPAIEEFIHAVGINMCAGYGLTESTATVSCDWIDKPRSIGSVGRIIPGVEVKIGENDEVSYIIYITDTKEEVNEIITNMFLNIFWALIFGLLISAILGFFLSRTIISPISSLQSRSEALAEGDFTKKLEVRSRDEIGRLTVAFNNMAARINSSMEEIQTEKKSHFQRKQKLFFQKCQKKKFINM